MVSIGCHTSLAHTTVVQVAVCLMTELVACSTRSGVSLVYFGQHAREKSVARFDRHICNVARVFVWQSLEYKCSGKGGEGSEQMRFISLCLCHTVSISSKIKGG